jgi:dephospho-CoA kinase
MNLISVGITGGIGSGKSRVCRVFAALGYVVYEADARAKALMREDPELRAAISDLFGPAAYAADGSLNRQHIGSVAFSQPEKLQQLNALVHPRTGQDYLAWKAEWENSAYDKPFVVKEAAILFESGAYRSTDYVISVYAAKSVRLRRVQARDGTEAEAVQARMAQQWPDLRKVRQADFVIYSDGHHPLSPQVVAAIQAIEAWKAPPKS